MPRRARLVLALALCLAFAPQARAGLEYVVNGNFEQGNTGFTSGYTYSPGELGPARTYDVVSNPAIDRPRDINPASFGDHTTGKGLMLAANGAEVANVVVWSETISLAAHADYDYSMWITSWFAGSPATFDILFNGVSVGTPTAPSTTGLWQEFSTTWNSGNSTSLTIDIIDTNLADIGSDFALDDISLTGLTPVPAPSGLVLALLGVAGLCGYAWRRRKLIATTVDLDSTTGGYE